MVYLGNKLNRLDTEISCCDEVFKPKRFKYKFGQYIELAPYANFMLNVIKP